MQSKTFSSSRIRSAHYDEATRQLDLHWATGSTTAYKHVPAEVWRRLCRAPNPATYWEDRIAEEYPKATPMPLPGATPAKPQSLSDLFGGADEKT